MLPFLKFPSRFHVAPRLFLTAFHPAIWHVNSRANNLSCYSTGVPVGGVHASNDTQITKSEHKAAVKRLEAEFYKRFEEKKVKFYTYSQEQLAARVQKLDQYSQDMEKNSKNLLKQRDEELGRMREDEEQDRKKIEELERRNQVLKDTFQKAKAARMTLQGNLSVCGALEYLVKRAPVEENQRPPGTIEQGFKKMVKQAKFAKTLEKEAEGRRLRVKDVVHCACHLYDVVAIRAGRDDDMVVVVNAVDFLDDELAALIVFLKVQDNWPRAIVWKGEKS